MDTMDKDWDPDPQVEHINGLQEFKDGMIENYRDERQFCQEDIALMTRIREGAAGETLRLCNYFIGHNLLEIQRVKMEMGEYRE